MGVLSYSASEKHGHTMPKGSGLTKPLNLSAELAKLLGTKKGEQLSRPEVVKRLWAYLKENKLQDPTNKQYFTPDKAMEPIFGKEKIRAFGMSKFLKKHLTSPRQTAGPHFKKLSNQQKVQTTTQIEEIETGRTKV